MKPARPKPPTRRVFFALWPDDATRRMLDALARDAHGAFGGRRMRAETLHMTLAFIGDIEAARLDALAAAAAGLDAPGAFAMRIDQLRCWRHNRIVWCGPSVMPPELERVATELRDRLLAIDVAVEARPFAAHGTLLRNADCSRSAPGWQPFDWPVRDFVLVESNLDAAGARYEVIGRWPLKA